MKTEQFFWLVTMFLQLYEIILVMFAGKCFWGNWNSFHVARSKYGKKFTLALINVLPERIVWLFTWKVHLTAAFLTGCSISDLCLQDGH